MSTMSVKMKKVHEMAKKIDTKLLATDERFLREVSLLHEDGSVMHFRNAFLILLRTDDLGPWVLCFTEHHGFHVYPMEDLLSYKQMNYIDMEEMIDEDL